MTHPCPALRGLSGQRGVICSSGHSLCKAILLPSYITSRPAGTSAAGLGPVSVDRGVGITGRKHVPAGPGHRVLGSQVAPCPSFPPLFPAEGPPLSSTRTPDAPRQRLCHPVLQGCAQRPKAHTHARLKCPELAHHLSPPRGGSSPGRSKGAKFVAGNLCPEVPPSHSGTPRGLGSSQAPREHEGQHSCRPGRLGEDSRSRGAPPCKCPEVQADAEAVTARPKSSWLRARPGSPLSPSLTLTPTRALRRLRATHNMPVGKT